MPGVRTGPRSRIWWPRAPTTSTASSIRSQARSHPTGTTSTTTRTNSRRARRLVRRVQDIERWLNACNAYVQHDGVASGAECERPCGHDDPHDPDPPPALAEQLCHESRVLTDVTERRPTVSAGSLLPSTSAAPHWIRWNASTATRSMTSPRPSTALNAMRDAWRTGSVSANRRDERTRRAEDPIVARRRACRCSGQRSDRGQRGHRPAAQASHAQTTRRYRAARGLGNEGTRGLSQCVHPAGGSVWGSKSRPSAMATSKV